MDRVLETQMDDEETQKLITARNDGKKKDFRVRESDCMLMQENMMYVLNDMELKKVILDEAYCSAYAIHPGGTKMYHTIRLFYYWLDMKREIVEYVSRCISRQQVKAERNKPFWIDAATFHSTVEMGKYHYGFCVQASSYTERV